MVIILQQTMDNGRRFVSTVVEEESSLNSNFSVGSSSHNSISERSAIYKQRIDSLFGRHTRLNPFKPAALEPFCIRIENSRLQQQYNGIVGGGSRESESRARSSTSVATTTTTQQQHQQQTTVSSVRFHHHRSTKSHHHQGSSFFSPCRKSSPSSASSSTTTVQFSTDNHNNNSSKNVSSHPTVTIEETDFSTSDDEDDDDVNGDYEKIGHGATNGSCHTDSLNTRPSPGIKFSDNGSNIPKENIKSWSPTGATNVSSVRLNCESGDSNDDGFPHHKVTTTMSSNSSSSNQSDMSGSGGGGGNKTIGESHMWHNGNFTDFHCNSDERQYGIVRAMSGGILKFTVDYLGCVPVDGTTTALQDLQAPLRSLYMNYLTGTNVMGGKLAITTDGLRFEAPKLRLVNPFATIAVWAAIKFVARGGGGESNNNNNSISECAFMPLISDPEGQDKSRLFSKMSSELHKAYTNCVNNNKQNFRNPPIFACVMREASFSLDCHAFACKCAEDAIVIAANLYQSLVDKMRAGNKEGESGYGSLTRNSPATTQSSPNQIPPHSNHHHRSSSSSVSSQEESPVDLIGVGNSCSSSNSSSNSPRCHDTTQELCRVNCPKKQQQQPQQQHDLNHRTAFSDSESVVPVRPPRRKKKSLDNGNTSSSSSNGHLKRYNSDDSVMVKLPQRKRSFKANAPHYTKAKKRVQITTPDEATSSDSVNECIDHVLDRVIHPGGMSFNDLKPPYQELILKIALTLTQDQLYQKSKQAMKKHHQQVSPRKKPGKTSPGGTTSDDNSQFLNNLLKSFSKITSSSKSSGAANKRKLGKMSSNFKNKVGYPPKVILKKPTMMMGKDEDPFQSYCSGCACDNCSDKCYCSLPSKHNVKAIGLPPPPPTSNTPSSGKSSSSPPSRNNVHNHTGKNGPNKGQKVMLGDGKEAKKTCGYDTDSCAESEKCYCSLQRVKSNGLKIYNINLDTETSDTDTNSYDFEPFNNKSAQDSSNKSTNSNAKGAKTRPVEILSYHPAKKVTYNLSPSSSASSSTAAHVQTTNAVVHFEHKQQQQQSKPKNSSSGSVTAQACVGGNNNCKLISRNHSLVSSSYLHTTMDEKLSSSSCESKKGVTQRNKVLLITGSSNPSTRLMYKDSYYQDGKKSRIDHRTNLMDITEDEDVSNEEDEDDDDDDDEEEDNSYRHHRLDSSNDDEMAPDKILSMKKTAEIAAMFTDLHLDQTTNIVPERSNSNNSSSFEDSSQTQDDSNGSVDFEASLGYLP